MFLPHDFTNCKRSYIKNNLILEYDAKNKLIKIRFLNTKGIKFFPEHEFNSKEKNLIRIGRSKKNEVVVNDISVSRIQCTLVFERNEWILYDGVYKNSKNSSTNGIW